MKRSASLKPNAAYRSYRLAGTALMLPIEMVGRRSCGRYPAWAGRLGLYPAELLAKLDGPQRIWLHAVSVGEVNTALSVIAAIRKAVPRQSLILSATTPHGLAHAQKHADPETLCLQAPLDFPLAVERALAVIKPSVLAFLETEIWPNWFFAARRAGVRIAIVNGRLSSRSIRRYQMIAPLMRFVLGQVERFSMISSADAARIQKLGAPIARVTVGGNAKYDRLASAPDPQLQCALKRQYRISDTQPVLVAGSLRRHEALLVLKAFGHIRERFADAMLILAPRHAARIAFLAAHVKQNGYICRLRSTFVEDDGSPVPDVVILDTMGELAATYSLATVAFVGGSLVPLGGQNLLEPAAWGRPVLYGPHVDDFLDAKALLDETGGGIQVGDSRELAKSVLALLADRPMAARRGMRARQAVMLNHGASEKHARVILDLLL